MCFAGVEYATDEERHAAWEEIKKTEKQGKEWQNEYLAKSFDESKELIDVAKKRKGFE